MPIYEYNCPEHGTQEHILPLREEGPFKERPCNFVLKTIQVPAEPNWLIVKQKCKKPSKLMVSAPAVIDIKKDWNDKANEQQRDPYTQAKAQLTNHANAEAERKGTSPEPFTEAQIQVAAKGIAEQEAKPKVDDTTKAVRQHRKNLKKVKKMKEKNGE